MMFAWRYQPVPPENFAMVTAPQAWASADFVPPIRTSQFRAISIPRALPAPLIHRPRMRAAEIKVPASAMWDTGVTLAEKLSASTSTNVSLTRCGQTTAISTLLAPTLREASRVPAHALDTMETVWTVMQSAGMDGRCLKKSATTTTRSVIKQTAAPRTAI